MQSPVLHSFEAPDDIRAIRVTMTAPPATPPSSPFEVAKTFTGVMEGTAGPRIAVKVVKAGELDTTTVDSVEAAENHIFTAATLREVENVEHHSGLDSTLFEVNRSGSFIAMRTRRGAGNVVILGSKIVEILSEHIEQCEPFEVGRWMYIGKYNGMAVHTGEGIASNEAIIAYVNKANPIIDGPGGIAPDGDGYCLATINNSDSTLGNLADYVQRLVVTNI